MGGQAAGLARGRGNTVVQGWLAEPLEGEGNGSYLNLQSRGASLSRANEAGAWLPEGVQPAPHFTEKELR